jgi:hypothetical protein
MNPDEDFHTLSKNVVARVLADSDLNSTARMDPHPVIIKVYLKYITTKNFDEISKDIIQFLNINAKHESDGTTLKTFTILTVDKACNDHSFTKMVARISRRIAEAISRDIKDEKVREKTGEFACGETFSRSTYSTTFRKSSKRGSPATCLIPKDLPRATPNLPTLWMAVIIGLA